MHVELTLGKDSFRAQGQSTKRNVSVSAFVRVKDDGEGRQVTPLFAAYTKKLKGFRNKNLLATIPATDNFAPNMSGQWFRQRYEVQRGTEILIEYRKRQLRGFGESVEYLLLIADETAPLWQLRLDLPEHHLSAVPNVHFEGRFEIIDKDSQLSEKSVKAWTDYFGLDEDFEVSDILDPNQEQVFKQIQLEARVRTTKAKVSVTETSTGAKRVRIRRTRNIKTN